MEQIIEVGALGSFVIAILVLFIGRMINSLIPVLGKFNLPEPIVGGLVIATVITVLHSYGVTLKFTLPLQNYLMLFFFSTVGLSASYKLLLKGGIKVFIFLGIATVYIVLQNAVGVGLATALGLDPLLGLIAGSISLSGGHGTSAAWSATFSNNYGINTLELAMAAATFGLVMGGLIGGRCRNG